MTDDNKVDIYKTILEQEVSNHTIFITVLLGIVLIVIGSTWWWNKYGALKEIENEVEKRIAKEKAKLLKQFKKKINKKIHKTIIGYEEQILLIEADVARSMAIAARNDEFYSHSVYWWSKYMDNNIKLDIQQSIRNSAEWLLADLELLKSQDENESLKPIHECESVEEIVRQLPEMLKKERKEILKMCNGRNNEDELE